MFEMRVEEHRDAGAAAVWHVVGKGSTSALCGRAAPVMATTGGNDVEATEHYCAPCMQAFGQAVAVGRST